MNALGLANMSSGACLLMVVGGCGDLGAIFSNLVGADRVTIVLTNNSDQFAVEAELFYDDEQNIPSSLLRELGQELVVTVEAGETVSFTRDCEDLQAVMIDDADLLVIGGAGPDDDTGVLRDGEDFGCGDTIVFTFTHTDLIVDFEIQTATQ